MKILITGDFCPQGRVAQLIEEEKYHDVFCDVLPYSKQADLSIVNLEAPIVEHEAKGIDKCGPCLKGTAKSVDAIKYAGFNVVTLANNHFYDYGEVGVVDTLQACREKGIITVGGGLNLEEASRTAYFDVKNKKLAIINCCEHEFSIATETSGGSNPLNPVQQYYAIQEARQKSDKVMIIVHGGHEYYQLPSPRMKETYRFFIDAGADVVINHHQHCYTGFEIYSGKPIFYGLGNFCFDGNRCQGHKMWNEGYFINIIIDESTGKIDFDIIPYIQCKEYPKVRIMNETEKNNFIEKVNDLNRIIHDEISLKSHFQNWCKDKYNIMELSLTPYTNRITTGMWRRKLLPSFLSKNRINNLNNKIVCESHRDVMINYLNFKYIDNNE